MKIISIEREFNTIELELYILSFALKTYNKKFPKKGIFFKKTV